MLFCWATVLATLNFNQICNRIRIETKSSYQVTARTQGASGKWTKWRSWCQTGTSFRSVTWWLINSAHFQTTVNDGPHLNDNIRRWNFWVFTKESHKSYFIQEVAGQHHILNLHPFHATETAVIYQKLRVRVRMNTQLSLGFDNRS